MHLLEYRYDGKRADGRYSNPEGNLPYIPRSSPESYACEAQPLTLAPQLDTRIQVNFERRQENSRFSLVARSLDESTAWRNQPEPPVCNPRPTR